MSEETKDILQVLCGNIDNMDEIDTLIFVVYGAEKFGRANVNINLEMMKLEVLDDVGKIKNSFEIQVSLKAIL